MVTDALLAMHPWRFAIKEYDLTKSADGNFLIPDNAKRILSASVPHYEVAGNHIRANADTITIAAIARVGCEDYPAYFVPAAATKLAMEFCIPLTENQNTFKILAALFESEIRTAKFIDSATTPHSDIAHFSLLSARF
jgi:hypothetical protein